MEHLFVKNYVRNINVALPLYFVIIVITPFEFFLDNHTYFTSTWVVIALGLLLILGACLSVTALILLVIERHEGIYGPIVGVLSAAALMVWLQANVFAWSFGPLDGRGINWEIYTGKAYFEIAIWGIFVFLFLLLCRIRGPKVFTTINKYLLILFSISFAATLSTHNFDYHIKDRSSSENYFKLHKDNNVFLVILDTFQGDIFSEIAAVYPEEIHFLDGFTFFPNAMGGYPTTQASVPLMLTGNFYRNEIPIDDWMIENNKKFSLPDALLEKDFGTHIGYLSLLNPTIFSGMETSRKSMADLSVSDGHAHLRDVLISFDGGMFKGVPTFLKKYVYNDGNWFFYDRFSGGDVPPGAHGEDIRFINTFEDEATVDSQMAGEFRLIHFAGAHWPLQLNENFEYVGKQPESRVSYLHQSRGALKLLERFVSKLKDLNLYEGSTIIIAGDHGSHSLSVPPSDIINEDYAGASSVSLDVLAGSRPLFLIKQKNSVGALNYNIDPIHLSDIPEVMHHCVFSLRCFSILKREDPVRRYYHYNWSSKFWGWDQKFMPAMQEFIVKGDVRNLNSWSESGKIFSNGVVRQATAKPYTPGTPISFKSGGNSGGFVKRGWSYAETTHRWTDGPIAFVSLKMEDYDGFSPLTVRFTAFSHGGTPREVMLFANNNEIDSLLISQYQEHEVILPAGMIPDGHVNLAIKIKDASAPCGNEISTDCRRLGLGFVSLIIDYAER